MTTRFRVGKDCYTYYSTASTFESPVWVLAENVRDESIDLAKSKAEFKSRASKFKRKKGALIECPVNISIEYKKSDPFMAVLMDSMLNNTPIDMCFMFDPLPPGEGETSEGYRMPLEVFDFPLKRDLEDGCMIEVGLELTEKVKADDSLQEFEEYSVED